MHVAVIDTNVVVSGLITNDVAAPTAKILDGMLTGRIAFALSDALLAEYREILIRPKLRARHGLSSAEIDTLLVAVARNAIVLDPQSGPPAPEPGDQHLWDLLASHADLSLVTGDDLLLRAASAPAPVVSPAQFIGRDAGD